MMIVSFCMTPDEHSPGDPEPPQLRFLRRLVTVLTAVMILGLLTITALLVIRLGAARPLPLPDEIALPNGARATAITRGPNWYAVVTEDDRILIYSLETGALRQEIWIAK